MSKDLGKSTSYAYYVAEGGTKTPQEYGEMLVNIDTVATRAEDAADSAAESATGALNSQNAAQTAATTATNKATEATTAATTATTKAGEASTSASTATSAKDTAVSASQTATSKATEATTAAATATSAKTDAVAANTAAQSAKTAAQTAQTGAETAAASVEASAEQIATNTEDISQLKSEFIADGLLTNASAIWTKVSGKYASSAGLMSDSAYDSYYFTTTSNIQIYSDGATDNGYYSITTYAGSISSANYITRKRKSEHNLPTSDSPMTVTANTVIVISIYHSDIGFTLNTTLDYNVRMADSVGLGAKQEEEVAVISNSRKCKIRYETGEYNQGATERICIYVPTQSGYICYILLHCVNSTTNADNWHIYRAYHVDNELNIVLELTTDGEWECAIALAGRSDYSGGYAHGDEVYTNLTVIVDGVTKALSDLSIIADATKIEILETSNMYDPNDSTTIIAVHGRRYVFSKDNLTINQTITWSYTGDLRDCYLAMFPPKKTVTDTYYLDTDYKPTQIPSSPNLFISDVAYSAVYKESVGVKAEVSVPIYPTGLNGSGVFSLRDNGSSAYNKMYYQICTEGASVTSGTVWKSKTIYRINR